MGRISFLFVLLFALSYSFLGFCQYPPSMTKTPEIKWNGFLRVGAMFTNSSYTYMDDVEKSVNYQHLSLLGLRTQSKISEKLAIHGLLTASGEKIQAEQYYLKNYFAEGLTLQLGRQALVLWFDDLRYEQDKKNSVFAPPEEFTRVLPVHSFSGLSFEFSSSHKNDHYALQALSGQLTLTANESYEEKIQAQDLLGLRSQVMFNHMRFYLTYLQGRVTYQALAIDAQLFSVISAGLQVKNDNLTWMIEHIATQNQQADATQIVSGNKATYGRLAYKFSPILVPFLTYIHSSAPDPSLYYGNQQTQRVGLLFAVDEQAQIRFHFSQVDVGRREHGLFTDPHQAQELQRSSVAGDSVFTGAHVFQLDYEIIF